jgi:CheY-like chemotaxis protein
MAVVLVVEDEDQVRVLAESYLEEQGHRVLSAGTPAGALALLHQSPAVDLLFTNLDLKGDIHTGIELAKAAVKLRPQLHVLYTTGRAITDGIKKAFRAGLGDAREALHGRGIARQSVDEFSNRSVAGRSPIIHASGNFWFSDATLIYCCNRTL